MNDQESREKAMRYLRQVCVAVAVLLFLYGILQLLKSISDLANIYVSYYLWVAFQIIFAILIIFIGFRAYSVAKTIKATSLTPQLIEARHLFLVPLLGCLALLPVTLYALPASNSIYPQLFQPNSAHNPISFPYRLYYRWNLQDGGSIGMYTTYIYPTMPYIVFTDVIPTIKGWIIIPYKIDGSNAVLQAMGPARAEIKLGMIENGGYFFRVVMSDAIDEFQIHKTDNKFWVEEAKATKGSVDQKSEFEKRLDGFRVTYIGYPNIDNETKEFMIERIQEIGGVILETKSYYEGWTVDVYFYYSGDFSNLRQIIRETAERYPQYMIGIYSNTEWFTLTWVPNSYKQ